MVSVFTPTNNPKFLKEAYESLKEQTYADWEWVIIPNGGAEIPDFKDDRIKIYPFEFGNGFIGALKRYACQMAKGEILVELDHDDMLTPDCLEELKKFYDEHPDASMVYSNFAQVDLKMNVTNTWSPYYGWEYKDFEYKGHKLKEVIAPLNVPQNFSRIWFAPHHVRSWRTSEYVKVGGHNASMRVGDDHEFILRNYLVGKIYHLPKCLYIVRMYDKNYTWLRNKEIQDTMWGNYNKYVYEIAEKWADENKLLKIDLCGGIDKPKGYTSIDIANGDIECDLNGKWKLEDNSVGVLRAFDAIEHLKDPINTMNEAWRVLAHGGFFFIMVPSTDGRGAFQDPTHCSFWNSNSFWYYTRGDKQKYVNALNCKFQKVRIRDIYPNQECTDNKILYTEAHLLALKKSNPKFHGGVDFKEI